MRKIFIGAVLTGILFSSLGAREVKVCNIARDYTPGRLVIVCSSDWKDKTTLKEMYKKGWHFVGSSLSGSGGGVVILER